jgi:hypothetical protein
MLGVDPLDLVETIREGLLVLEPDLMSTPERSCIGSPER